MPKQKTHKGTKKRFRLTATGKVKHRRAGTSHLQVRVSAKRKQKLRGTGVLPAVDTPRIVEVLGKYSYCIYLTHFLVIEFVAHQVLQWQPETLLSLRTNYPPTLLLLTFTLTCLALTWLLALTSWHLFEKWFLHLKRHYVSTVPGQKTTNSPISPA